MPTNNTAKRAPSPNPELCLNWWPLPNYVNNINDDKSMPHPLCRICGNWLPDIEDIGNIIPCGNNWNRMQHSDK